MIRLSATERAIMTLARLVAGRTRSDWLNAMEAELMMANDGRFDWALGTLVASAKDRAARDWPMWLALVALPGAALVAIPPLSMLAAALTRPTGLSVLQLMPLVALAPAPFAVALGAVHPQGSPWLKGLLAFALYQLVPAVAFSLLFGTYVTVRWEANLSATGLTPPLGLLSALAVWCGGGWLGAQWARDRENAA